MPVASMAVMAGKSNGYRARLWAGIAPATADPMHKSERKSRANVVWAAGLAAAGLIGVSIIAGKPYDHHRVADATRLAALSDSVASLARRTTALELVAGLEPDDSVASTSDTLVEGRADRVSADLRQVSEKLLSDADRVARTPSIMPTAGWLTSQFSMSRFHPILHRDRPHLGIDIAAPYGEVIVAPAAGTVVRVGTAAGYGRVLEIDHGNGIVTKYGHLSSFLVRDHDQVVRGQPIARVGNSGLTTGPHLHYEVHVNGEIVDPLSYVLPSTIPDPIHRQRAVAAPED